MLNANTAGAVFCSAQNFRQPHVQLIFWLKLLARIFIRGMKLLGNLPKNPGQNREWHSRLWLK